MAVDYHRGFDSRGGEADQSAWDFMRKIGADMSVKGPQGVITRLQCSDMTFVSGQGE